MSAETPSPERDTRKDPLADYAQENPVPDANAYAAAYARGVGCARRSAPFARLLLSDCTVETAEAYTDEFAARYAAMYLMAFADTGTN